MCGTLALDGGTHCTIFALLVDSIEDLLRLVASKCCMENVLVSIAEEELRLEQSDGEFELVEERPMPF